MAAAVSSDPPQPAATGAKLEKEVGDISNVFASMTGGQFQPLEARFATVKAMLAAGHEKAITESWNRLLLALQKETEEIVAAGSQSIPEINFSDLRSENSRFRTELAKRGVAVIRNVVSPEQALEWKASVREYIKKNPQTKAFPPEDPQVYEIYWSHAQVQARGHPNMIAAQRFLMDSWHSRDPKALISLAHPIAYADRLRIRQPGDAHFALGPHVDGGSCERWEAEGYRRGKVYDNIWQGKWEDYEPWEASGRLSAVSDLYQGIGVCSMFRMFQGWLALSETGPKEGTLLVNPLLKHATAYFLLRPFFTAKSPPKADCSVNEDEQRYDADYLAPENWQLDLSESNTWLHGARPGQAQELRPQMHPHLDLPRTMVHIPKVHPGDYVAWHCDTIHAVDNVHAGKTDSSVIYLPTCPLTVANAEYMVRQRHAFNEGYPCPDNSGGKGENGHVGRPTKEDVQAAGGAEALQALGLVKWDSDVSSLLPAQREVMYRANEILGF